MTNRKNELHFDWRVTCFASLATSDMGVLCQHSPSPGPLQTIITKNDAAGFRILAHFWQKVRTTFLLSSEKIRGGRRR